jgi:hypothetical protein
MSWTKRQFCVRAYRKLGYASYDFTLTDDMLKVALDELDAMMGTWNFEGIRISYPLPDNPDDSSLDTATDVPDSANEAIWSNLTIRLADSVGKEPTRSTKVTAKKSYNVLLGLHTEPNNMQFNRLPAGQGNKSWRNTGRTFLPPAEDRLDVGQDGTLDFE